MKNAMSLEALNYAFLRLCVKDITQFPSTNSEAKQVFCMVYTKCRLLETDLKSLALI